MYDRPFFNDEATLCFIGIAVMRIPLLITFAIYRGVPSFYQRKEVHLGIR